MTPHAIRNYAVVLKRSDPKGQNHGVIPDCTLLKRENNEDAMYCAA